MSTVKRTDAKVRKGASFSRQVEAFVGMAKERANVVVRKTALGLLANVVEASPVDTGRFRGNWQVGIGARPSGTTEDSDKDGSGVVTAAASQLEAATLGNTVYVTNNLPYARRLEFGHSAQAPRGMVRITVARLREILEGAVEDAKQGGGGGGGGT
ncbi:HK97 gp10 family phage protein [Myxococcus eversor]|uniref:HK97 gp10 family phage protein n=1 Tax=Myxococcus eversor TaxID=2709661 RepID=UPI0013D49CC9|nr:HK97 gp10 family phage protein [Myxococcus eversor]